MTIEVLGNGLCEHGLGSLLTQVKICFCDVLADAGLDDLLGVRLPDQSRTGPREFDGLNGQVPAPAMSDSGPRSSAALFRRS